MSRPRRLAIAAAAASCATLAALAPSAVAAAPRAPVPCDASAQQVFGPLGDTAYYQLVQDGNFASGAPSWIVGDGATVVQDAQIGMPALDTDHNALELTPGASAISPPVCVTKASEAFRFLASVSQPWAGGDNLQVDVIYPTRLPVRYTLSVTSDHPVPVERLAMDTEAADRAGRVVLRFRAINGATVRIDDVYMDPRLH